jgi:hypothetical protein
MWRLSKKQGSEEILINDKFKDLDEAKSAAINLAKKDNPSLDDKTWAWNPDNKNYYELSVGGNYRLIIRNW